MGLISRVSSRTYRNIKMQAENSVPKELVDQFLAITQGDRGSASFYLEAAGNDLNEAVSQYFSSNPGSNLGRVGKDTSDDKKAGGNEFYAGGAGRDGGSGQNVIAPSSSKKSKMNAEELIGDMFKSAKESGAEQMESSRSTGQFSGGSNNLNNESGSAPTKEKIIVLKMWKNGFTVGAPDEEALTLRLYDDAQNQQFMDSIKKGEVPTELRAQVQNGNVALDMEDHRDEDYTPPKVILFTGSGNQLGGEPKKVESNTSVNDSDIDNFELEVNENEPVTNIRIRLSNGQTVVQKFNKTHCIKDLRLFIAKKSGKIPADFNIMTSFPRKNLTNDEDSLESAGLLNSQVIQQ